jgi:hypothetical protein
MASDYNDLLEEITNEIVRPDLHTKAKQWVANAEKYLARELQLSDAEQLVSGSTVSGQAYIELPPGFKRPIHFEFQTSPLRVLNQVSWTKYSDVKENDVSGTPRTVTYHGNRAYIAPTPGSAIAYDLYYYGTPPPLSETNATNDLMNMGADVLFYKSLTYSAPYIGDDERIGTWNAFVADAIPGLKKEYWESQNGGGVMRIRPDVIPRDSHF